MAYTTITDPSAYFQTVLWSGSGSGQAITNGGNSDLQPDWVWIKKRAGGTARSHQLYDSSRGVTKLLHSDAADAEQTQSQGLTAFGSDGFTVGSNDGVDGSGGTYVAWQWKANGGTTSSNTDGTITSTVQADTTAGFSIVQYVGNGSSGATFGHGLGVAPELVILKNRDTARSWFVGHLSLGFNYVTHLNQSTASDANSVYWNNTAPSSTVVTLGNNEGGNENTNNFVAYCFKQIQGYSSFGSYTGNGNADGPFIYTGFKPAWIMWKRTDAADSWVILDSDRNTFNVMDNYLLPNSNGAEASADFLDFTSNGIKIRNTFTSSNNSGSNYIYLAFAENPFVATNGVPTTAR
jgi:hypothetical protein